MNLNLDDKYVYDIIENIIKECDANPGLYEVEHSKAMAIFKRFRRKVPSAPQMEEVANVTLGVHRNRSKLYVTFHYEFSSNKEITVHRPWFKGRVYHNSLISKIRSIVASINEAAEKETRERVSKEFMDEIRATVPGALNSIAEEAMLKDES